MAAGSADSAPAKRAPACALCVVAHGDLSDTVFCSTHSHGVQALGLARSRGTAAQCAVPPEIFLGAGCPTLAQKPVFGGRLRSKVGFELSFGARVGFL